MHSKGDGKLDQGRTVVPLVKGGISLVSMSIRFAVLRLTQAGLLEND